VKHQADHFVHELVEDRIVELGLGGGHPLVEAGPEGVDCKVGDVVFVQFEAPERGE
jgi:hypothetical protein